MKEKEDKELWFQQPEEFLETPAWKYSTIFMF